MSNDTFAKEFVAKLDGKVSDDELKLILQELEIFIGNFDISRKSTELDLYRPFLPECYKIYFVAKKIEGLSIDTLKTYDFNLRKFLNMLIKIWRIYQQMISAFICMNFRILIDAKIYIWIL